MLRILSFTFSFLGLSLILFPQYKLILQKPPFGLVCCDHLNLATKEVVARLHGDWAGDIAAYDAVQQQMEWLDYPLLDTLAGNLFFDTAWQ